MGRDKIPNMRTVADDAAAGEGEARASGRKLRLLLPWAQAPAIEALYRGLRIEDPPTARQFYGMLQRRREALAARGPISFNVALGVEKIGPPIEAAAAEVVASDTYQDRYGYLGGEVVRLPVRGLITPQVVADWDYVEEVRASAPVVGDDEGVFRLCFGDDELGDAVLLTGGPVQSATVKLHRGQPAWVGPLRARRAGGRVTVSFDLEARGRFVQVAVVPLNDGQTRVVVVNGVHRLLALLADGHEFAYGIARALTPQELQSCFEPGPALIADPVGRPLPARLEDFVDENMYDVVRQTPVDVYMRMLVHSDNVITSPGVSVMADADVPVPVTGEVVETLPGTTEPATSHGPVH